MKDELHQLREERDMLRQRVRALEEALSEALESAHVHKEEANDEH